MKRLTNFLVVLICLSGLLQAQELPLLTKVSGAYTGLKEMMISEDGSRLILNYNYNSVSMHTFPDGELIKKARINDFISLRRAYIIGDTAFFPSKMNVGKTWVFKQKYAIDEMETAKTPKPNHAAPHYGKFQLTYKDFQLKLVGNTIHIHGEKPTPVVLSQRIVSASDTGVLKKQYLVGDDYYGIANKVFTELTLKGKYEDALFLYKKIIEDYDIRFSWAHAQVSWCYLHLKQFEKASEYASYSYQITPANVSSVALKAYCELAENKLEKGKKSLRLLAFTILSDQNVPSILDDFNALIQSGVNPGVFEQMKSYWQQVSSSRSRIWDQVSQTRGQAFQDFQSQNAKDGYKKYQDILQQLSSAPQEFQYFKSIIQHNLAIDLFYSTQHYESINYQEVFEKNFEWVFKYPEATAKMKAEACWFLGKFYYGNNRTADAKQIIEKVDPYIARLNDAYFGDILSDLLQVACGIESRAEDDLKLRKYANLLLKNDSKQYSQLSKAEGYNYLGMSYLRKFTSSGKLSARRYFTKALQIAEENNIENIIRGAKGNLALVAVADGESAEAIQIYKDLIKLAESEDDWFYTELYSNNLGGIYFNNKNYQAAIPYFQKAVNAIEQKRNSADATVEERIQFFERTIGAYQFLAMCFAYTNDAASLFKIQNQMRSRGLAEKLGDSKAASVPYISLPEFQQSLGSDEAALYYSIAEPGKMVINLITRDAAQAKYVANTQKSWVLLKDKWLDRFHRKDPPGSSYRPVNHGSLTKALNELSIEDMEEHMDILRGVIDNSILTTESIKEEILREYLGGYYNMLISPFESQLVAKSKLLIFPDGILNFLPFDALMDSKGTYLAERFDVRFSPSAEVRKLLQNRTYAPNRKSFFAMGGATYGSMEEKSPSISKESRYISLKIKVAENVKSKSSQREVFASIFGNHPMNYLPGTLHEVQNLSKIFPTSTVLTGNDMSESNIKQLSRSGELQKYKVIHLATHGFAVTQFPKLSGIAMCIYPQMKNGEDGYLTAPEIANLDIEADLMVLSACETALGKIYGGEGVAGLMESMLVGGANNTLVTLWPVSDLGTMYFMSGLYELVLKQGKTYAEASAAMKRLFIQGDFGEQFKDPKIWAPFVHYGI